MPGKPSLLACLFVFSASIALANHYGSPSREVPLPFPPEAYPTGHHYSPDIACSGEECLAVWMLSDDKQGFTYDVRAMRVSKSGHVLDSSPFVIASPDAINTSRPQVVATDSGYAVFYSGGLMARISRDGRLLSRDVPFSFSNRLVSVVEAVTAGGNVLLYWVENQGPLVPDLTLLDSDLKEIRDVKVDGYTQDIAASGTGFAVASTAIDGLKVTRLGSDGSRLSESVIPVQVSSAAIAATASGAIVAWRRSPSNDTPPAVECATISSGAVQRLVLDTFVGSGGASSLDVESDGSGYLVAWSRPSSGYYTDNVYLQRISAAGQRIDAQPVAVSPRALLQYHAKAAPLSGGYIVVWADSRYGLGHDQIFASMVPAGGTPGSDFLVSRRLTSQSSPVLATAGNVVGLAWNESIEGGPAAVMFARAMPGGSLLDPLRLADAGGAPAIVSHGDAFTIAWNESGALRVVTIGTDGRTAAMSRIDAHATGDVSIAANSVHLLLVWPVNDSVMVARVRYDGSMIDSTPVAIASGSEPKAAFDGSVWWIVDRAAGSNAVEGRRLSRDGSLIDLFPFTISNEGDSIALACGSGTCVALWRSGPAIDGAMLTAGGVVPAVFTQRAASIEHPALAWNGRSYLLTWAEKAAGETNFDIHASELSASGNLIDAEGDHRVTESDTDEQSPAVTSVGTQPVFAFSRWNDAGEQIYLRFADRPPRRRAAGT